MTDNIPAADEVVDAEVLDEEPDWSGSRLPAPARRPRYLVDRHTVLGPDEMPPTAEDEPAWTEADFRVSADTAERLRKVGADNTRINRDATVTRFEAWCRAEGRVARPCTDATFLEYTVHLMRQRPRLKADSITVYLGHIWRWQPAGRRPDRVALDALLAAYRRENPRATRKRQAPPLRLPDVLAMLDAIDETTPTGMRDAALLVVMYLMLGRRSEPAALDIEYTTVMDHQAVLDLAADKTHPDGDGLDLVRLHDRPDLQPVRRLRAWLGWLKSQDVVAGPVFRQLSTGHRLTARSRGNGPGARLSAAAVGDRIQVLAANADIVKPVPVTSQGVRAGAATDLAENGVRGRQLARAGRWAEDSPIPERVYVRPSEDADGNPFAAVATLPEGGN